MSATASLNTAQYRLAQHYLDRLQQANAAICRGQGNRAYWLALVEKDWGQIKHWQEWAASGTGHDTERARLCSAFSIATTDVLRAKQTPPEHLAWILQALEAARKIGNGVSERALLYQLGLAYVTLEILDKADQAAQELMDNARQADDEASMGRAGYLLGHASFMSGRYDEAEAHYRGCIDLLIANNAIEETARVWRGFGRIALYRGDYQHSYDHHMRYLNMVAGSGNARELGAAHVALCGVLMSLHQFEAAEESASRALEIARSNGFQRMIPPALVSLSDAERELGKLSVARAHCEEGVAAARAISPPSTLVNGLQSLARIYICQDDSENGLALLEEALRLAREARLPFRICEVAYDLAGLYLAWHDESQARGCLRELVASARQLNTPHFMASALAASVLVWSYSGQHEQATLWAGLLVVYRHNLEPMQFDDTLYGQLEKVLGSTRYEQSLQHGKTLNIDVVMSDIQKAL